MKLEILVPQYKEDDIVIEPLLKSVADQKFVRFDDISIIICNDGSDVLLSDSLLSGWPFSVRYYKEPHRGVSGTRNACLKYSKADYIMWCDADDRFFNPHGLWMVFNAIADGNFDIFSSAFEEEDYNGRRAIHIQDDIFVHGKVYRREFLIENGLWWDESLTIHEDRYFTRLAMAIGKVHYCSTPFYLWSWNNDSVTRKSDYFMSRTYRQLLQCNTKLLNELASRGYSNQLSQHAIDVVMVFMDIYKDGSTDEYEQENRNALMEYCYRFRDLVLPKNTSVIAYAIQKLHPEADEDSVKRSVEAYVSDLYLWLSEQK